MDANPYDILKVPKNASLAEIKSAYKKLALKWHPVKIYFPKFDTYMD
jgi:curved DNA-binding protein CbpA